MKVFLPFSVYATMLTNYMGRTNAKVVNFPIPWSFFWKIKMVGFSCKDLPDGISLWCHEKVFSYV